MDHRFLFILEIAPVEVGRAYETLPSHLTLMSRFFSKLSPEELTAKVQPLFEQAAPLHLVFDKLAQLGPQKLNVHLVQNTAELKQLHNQLLALLIDTGVTSEYPAYTGKGHKPHVTERNGMHFTAGSTKQAAAAYLVEVLDKKRVIRARFDLKG